MEIGRTFTKAALQRTSAGLSGAAKIGVAAIAGVTGADVQAVLESIKGLLDNKADATPNGYAPLGADGKVPDSFLSALALTDVHVVASQAAQLALSAQEGDIAVRTDQNKSYAHNGGTAGTMADWTELRTPTDAVLSVDGRTGAVSLSDLYAALSHKSRHEPGGADAMTVDAVAATGSLRSLGTGAQQAAAGNDSRLSDQRTPADGSVTAAKMATTNKGVVICTSTTRPASPVEGQLIYETDTDNVMKNTGTPASPSWQNVSGAAASSTPTGTILPYAGSSAPSGYLICDGSEFLSATYPDLATLLGTTWGTAAAGNTKLPDLRGRTLIGAGTGSGLTARTLGQQNIGAETHLLTSAESGLPAHTHNVPSGQNTVARTSSGANTAGVSAGATDANTAANAASAHNNMQPSAVVNYIIKT